VIEKIGLLKALKALVCLACRSMKRKNTFNTHFKRQPENLNLSGGEGI
jgi:hypothetical protein